MSTHDTCYGCGAVGVVLRYFNLGPKTKVQLCDSGRTLKHGGRAPKKGCWLRAVEKFGKCPGCEVSEVSLPGEVCEDCQRAVRDVKLLDGRIAKLEATERNLRKKENTQLFHVASLGYLIRGGPRWGDQVDQIEISRLIAESIGERSDSTNEGLKIPSDVHDRDPLMYPMTPNDASFGVYTTKGQAEAAGRLIRAMATALTKVFAAGVAHGDKLWVRLASGESTVTDYNRDADSQRYFANEDMKNTEREEERNK